MKRRLVSFSWQIFLLQRETRWPEVWCLLTNIIKKELEPKYRILPVLGVGLVTSQGKAPIFYILTHMALDVLGALCMVTSTWVLLTLILLTWRIWWVPNNVSKWQMGFNLAFKGLNHGILTSWIHISLICDKRVTTQNLWFFRRNF
jgi:hypothetical protein